MMSDEGLVGERDEGSIGERDEGGGLLGTLTMVELFALVAVVERYIGEGNLKKRRGGRIHRESERGRLEEKINIWREVKKLGPWKMIKKQEERWKVKKPEREVNVI